MPLWEALPISEDRESSPKRIKVEHPPRTPSPKPRIAVETEATPKNISQLGFDVALTPKAGNSKSDRQYGESLYTQAFEAALDTVLEHERYLFSSEEVQIFDRYRRMSYEGRFLYVRLFLRKKSAWFRVDKLGYESDIAYMDKACAELWESALADDEQGVTELEVLLGMLSLDELKILAKQFTCQGNTRDKLITSLCTLSKYQTGLQRSGSLGLSIDDSGKPKRTGGAILLKVQQMLGKMIRLRDAPVALFNRLHIVFYRSSEYNEKSLTTLILARISRRNFPHYQVDRNIEVFKSRDSLIQYETALLLKAEAEEIMEFHTTTAGLERVMEIFDQVWESWQILVLQEQAQPDEFKQSNYYSRRFTAGWIWTKLIYYGANVLAKRHEYRREHEVWTVLLSQKVFRLGKRGEWYDRKALIEQHYTPTAIGDPSDAERRSSKRQALATCISGLQDPDTHQIYHNALQRRIERLETDLRLPRRERHNFSHIIVRRPAERTMSGHRLDDRLTGKHSVWRGREDHDAEVGVEQLCLEQYEEEGWKGFHSENSIVTTLFAMLFWDIIFLPIPGVFQTAFQTAPLDLATDAFFPIRASEINHRLASIENGGYEELIVRCDEQHRARETWCVGMKWDYTLQDLVEIAHCIGGSALARLCRLFAEEYGHRVGGVGDLCLWKAKEKACMFVEVKGPGDRLSEKQIAWLDQMSLAGMRVELCHVVEAKS